MQSPNPCPNSPGCSPGTPLGYWGNWNRPPGAATGKSWDGHLQETQPRAAIRAMGVLPRVCC